MHQSRKALLVLRANRSPTILGTMRPTVIANKIKTAVVPFSRVASASAGGAAVPKDVICTNTPATWNRNTPGISETTDANPRPANGKCSRSAVAVANAPASRQAAKAPTSGLAWAKAIKAQREA